MELSPAAVRCLVPRFRPTLILQSLKTGAGTQILTPQEQLEFLKCEAGVGASFATWTKPDLRSLFLPHQFPQPSGPP